MGESIPDFERTSVLNEHLLHEQLEKVLFLRRGDGVHDASQVGQDLVDEFRPERGEVQFLLLPAEIDEVLVDLAYLGR